MKLVGPLLVLKMSIFGKPFKQDFSNKSLKLNTNIISAIYMLYRIVKTNETHKEGGTRKLKIEQRKIQL